MQGAAEGGTPMQATPRGLSKQGNAADSPENNLVKPKIWETQVIDPVLLKSCAYLLYRQPITSLSFPEGKLYAKLSL